MKPTAILPRNFSLRTKSVFLGHYTFMFPRCLAYAYDFLNQVENKLFRRG